MRDPSIALIVFQPQRQPQGEQVQLNEIWNGRKGSQDDAFVVEFVRVFRVFTSDTNDGPLVARTVQTQGFLSATNASRCSLGSRSRQPALLAALAGQLAAAAAVQLQPPPAARNTVGFGHFLGPSGFRGR